jgi:hypothetical protein
VRCEGWGRSCACLPHNTAAVVIQIVEQPLNVDRCRELKGEEKGGEGEKNAGYGRGTGGRECIHSTMRISMCVVISSPRIAIFTIITHIQQRHGRLEFLKVQSPVCV